MTNEEYERQEQLQARIRELGGTIPAPMPIEDLERQPGEIEVKKILASAAIIATLALTSSSAPVRAANCPLNIGHYNKLRTGMTLAEVNAIVGCVGEEVMQTEVEGYSLTGVNWMNSDFAMLVVSFINGKLASKVQMGLK